MGFRVTRGIWAVGDAQMLSRFALGLQSTINCNNNTCPYGPAHELTSVM